MDCPARRGLAPAGRLPGGALGAPAHRRLACLRGPCAGRRRTGLRAGRPRRPRRQDRREARVADPHRTGACGIAAGAGRARGTGRPRCRHARGGRGGAGRGRRRHAGRGWPAPADRRVEGGTGRHRRSARAAAALAPGHRGAALQRAGQDHRGDAARPVPPDLAARGLERRQRERCRGHAGRRRTPGDLRRAFPRHADRARRGAA
ncbi:hypothetical protein D3C72_1633790 [compost metagenome]